MIPSSDVRYFLGGQASRRSWKIGQRDFAPILARHTKSFNLIDILVVGVEIGDERAKLISYAVFVDGKPVAPRTLLPEVHRL